MNITCFSVAGLCLTAMLSACNKPIPIPKQFSSWNFSGTEYRTNNTDKYENKAGSGLRCHDSIGFSISFRYSRLPRGGEWPIKKTETSDPAYVAVYFYLERRDNNYYKMSAHDTGKLVATEQQGKALYTLAPTWFVHVQNPADSVLISGTFNAP